MTALSLFIGIDWGSESHHVCGIDASGQKLFEESVANTGEAIESFCARVLERAGGVPEAVAASIEAPHGAIIEALIERGIAVYSINPKQLDRFRDRHTVAGAKDDRRDAYVLADSLHTDMKLYRRVELGEPQIVELRSLSRAYDELTADIVALSNQLREQVRRYYPQISSLGDLHEEAWVWELFEQAPTPAQAKHLQRAKVEAVLKKHRIRRWTPDRVLEVLRQKPLPVAPGVVEGARAHAELILPRLRLAHEQRRSCLGRMEALIAKMSESAEEDGGGDDDPDGKRKPSDAAILLSLKGLGTRICATMLVEATTALCNRDLQALRAQTGVAPVSSQTGKQRRQKPTVTMRRACNGRLRNAVYHWARVSMQFDEHSHAHYRGLRGRGHSHGRSLRGVADRLLSVLVAMLKSRSLYDPTRRHQVAASSLPVTAGA